MKKTLKKTKGIAIPFARDNRYVVIVNVESEYNSTKDIIQALKKSLTEWVNETQAGRDAWEYTVEDFNISDLIDVGIGDDIKNFLCKNGIHKLTFLDCDGDIRSRDEVLVFRDEISEVEKTQEPPLTKKQMLAKWEENSKKLEAEAKKRKKG
jgi:hypothetical protein